VGQRKIIANVVAEDLEGNKRALVVRFDPWFFSGISDLLGAFFAVLADALGKDKRLKKAAGKVKDYAGVLTSLATAVPAVGGTVGAVTNAAASAAGIVAEPESLQERRTELADALRAAKARVVVIIDDVDRLADSEVVEIVRLAKLVGDLPKMTYILSFDRARVEEVLGGGTRRRDRERGRAYMEKIVQSRFDVPPVRSPALAELMVEQLNELLTPYPLTSPP
jgi:predicted KAP-like P-loop ATPase